MLVQSPRRSLLRLFAVLAMLLSSSVTIAPQTAQASHTPLPTGVFLAGDVESEATSGACSDWDPSCAAAQFAVQGNGVYLFPAPAIPAGNWQYKVALNGSWAENYGADYQLNGPNINLTLAAGGAVRFYYDHKTHYIADSVRNTIYTVPGSFNQAIGCAGDWQPECLQTFMSDVDGDGVYTFVSEAIPAGNYEFKIATNENWGNPNYGQGGGGANVAFTVPGNGFRVAFSFDTTNNTPTVTVTSLGPKPDNNVEWDGLRHDSRDPLYRTPGGAVPAGTAVKLRLRTFHNDVTSVKLRAFDLNANSQRILPMAIAASDVDCYGATPPGYSCDFWEITLTEAEPNNLWVRFIVTDGTDTDYYDDNTAALDGGLGHVTDEVEDDSYALMFYNPAFSAPAWARTAFMYQIFPDRFRNGRANDDPKTNDVRYDDPVLALPWGTLPEGYCRNYADGATNCPWRFDTTPPADSPTKEQPRGRDYFAGDLKGVDQVLDYLQALGVNTLYFNPLFDAGSNHSYDTQDYFRIDPYFGTQKDWENLVKHTNQRGMRIVLDGVFNHLSSDSPIFDRYHHYAGDGACEAVNSRYRAWFTFHDVPAGTGTCAGSAGPGSATYDGWFGFDSIPVLNKANQQVKDYFVSGANSVSRYWLNQGAGGWRLDVMGDSSFPNGYWEEFRNVVRNTKADALIVGELWQKDSTLLRYLRGDRADTTMNYRLRDAVIGLLAPGPFDAKGFGDSGRVIAPSEFANRLASIREDYPDAAYYSLMNLLDSHDTERLLWTLTPGAETKADKEQNAANLAAGKQRLRLASLIQFTVPGAPTVFYGDEVGLTGDDDPDDRRTFPWPDRGGAPDVNQYTHYQDLAKLRQHNPVLTDGDFRILLADDAAGVVAYGRKIGSQAAVVIVNRSTTQVTSMIPVAGYLPEGLTLQPALVVGSGSSAATVTNGQLPGAIGPMSGVVLMANSVDLAPPDPPAGLAVTAEGNGQISLSWNGVNGAGSYNIYRSPVSGGGYVKAGTTTQPAFTEISLRNGQTYYYVVRALDAAGNESRPSNEVNALPHYTIDWANLQWPATLTHTIDTVNRTDNVYGKVWIDGVTNQPGATPTLRAQLGYGPDGTNPTAEEWTWIDAGFNIDAGNNDEYVASLLPEAVGTFDYAYRYSTTNGRDWVYADLDGIANGYDPNQAGSLAVNSSGDTAAPATPANLTVVSASPAGVSLAWDAIGGDPTLYGYEVLRSSTAGGPYTVIGTVTTAVHTDTNVVSGATYAYVVRALDSSFNRSGNSPEVQATAELRTVTLAFNVTVPSTTDATGRSVFIAGFLDRLDGNLPQWNPGGVVLTRADATHWTITLAGKETTQIEYKYALGAWDYVEKDAACGETANRQLTLTYGATGTQTVNDTVLNWRNVAPCGN
jgi:glycosidase